jgi:transcriptional regulator with XRE-family HTH domain
MPTRLPFHVAFGRVVRQLREERGLSQEELEPRPGCTGTASGRWSAANSRRRSKSVEILAASLGLPASELIARLERLA